MNGTKTMDWKNYLLVIICVLCLAAIGCQSILDRITPSEIPEISMDYAETEPNEIGFKSLYDAKKIKDKIIIKHRSNQKSLLRLAEDDKLAYGDAIKLIVSSIEESKAFQDLVIGSEGNQFSIMGILAGLTGGAAIGKALKRKGDFSPEEHIAEVEKVRADTIKEINGHNNS